MSSWNLSAKETATIALLVVVGIVGGGYASDWVYKLLVSLVPETVAYGLKHWVFGLALYPLLMYRPRILQEDSEPEGRISFPFYVIPLTLVVAVLMTLHAMF